MKMHYGSLIGESPVFVRALNSIPIFTASEATVLITGETGTGKELFARAIHYHSNRQSKPFVPINCAAVPDHLLENELFGHIRGAFTDASGEQKGLLAEAEGGTLFLDEINSLSLATQAKLLRVLQDKKYRALGSPKVRHADVRIIAATNADLLQQVESGAFRQDLYYRLRVLLLHIPPLRERVDDIVLLAIHLLEEYATLYNRGRLRFSATALEKLRSYSWPGNVRELQGITHQAVLMSASSVISATDLNIPINAASVSTERDDSDILGLRALKASTIEQFERAYLSEMLAANQGNVSRAAKQAGKERRTFQRLLKKYGLSRSSFVQTAELS